LPCVSYWKLNTLVTVEKYAGENKLSILLPFEKPFYVEITMGRVVLKYKD
jgi:hypothetical protein